MIKYSMSKKSTKDEKALFGGLKKVSFDEFESNNSHTGKLGGLSFTNAAAVIPTYIKFSDLKDENLLQIAAT